MKKKRISHFITIGALIVFIVLGVASATGLRIGPGEASRLYFNANGGIGTVPVSETIEKGGSIIIPPGDGLSFGDAVFMGWFSFSAGTKTNYSAGESFTPPGGHITLFARWELDAGDLRSIEGLANKLVWLQNNAENGGNYTLEVNADETIGLQILRYQDIRNITITLRGVGENRVISSATNGTLFSVSPGVTLVLDNNIILRSGARVIDLFGVRGEARGGILRMNAGSAVIGVPPVRGDTVRIAVSVGASCSFTMNGGTISNSGVGVEVWNEASFIMNGGTISDNNVGVWVNTFSTGTLFTMNNGIITRNNYGVDSGRSENFRRIGGSVSGNTQDIRNPRF
jgi:hypothetical protein